jgi:multiple sugar transport system permease protein
MQRPSHSSFFNYLTKSVSYFVLLLWSFVCLFPLYWVGVTSLKGIEIIDKAPRYIPFLDFTPTLDAWRFILIDANENLLWRAFNSIFIGLCATSASVVLGGMAVYAISRFNSKTRFMPKTGTAGFMVIMLSSRILPPVTIVLPLYFMAEFTGMRDSLAFLIFVYTAINLPLAVWMLTPVFGSHATEQEEAAQLDGASHLLIFFGILIPMLKTAMITVGLLIFLQCWNEYLFAVYLTSDHALTVPPWMVGQLSMKEAQIGGEADEWTHLSAATIFMAVPALLFTIFTQRYLARAFVSRAVER